MFVFSFHVFFLQEVYKVQAMVCQEKTYRSIIAFDFAIHLIQIITS